MLKLEYEKWDSVRLSDDLSAVVIIDQTLLPNEVKYLSITDLDDMCEAIKSLRVRGAPAIGIFAGYCMYLLAKQTAYDENFLPKLKRFGEILASSRPTAVNLSWAVKRQLVVAEKSGKNAVYAMLDEAVKIHTEDIASCRSIAENTLSLLHDGMGVLTHCNAGALACSRLGTGLGGLILGAQRGYKFKAFVDETRPLMQGARLTAFELKNAGIEVNLICDSMAAYFMSKGEINAVIVGCDRVAANGDTANKIGTLNTAILAKYFGIPFYVCCPESTFDKSCKTGADIVIEERNGNEVAKGYFKERIVPHGTICRNPAFDVTPRELITAIVTEKQIFY